MGYSAPDGTKQKFTQKERDNESGLDYFGARYYSGAQGRFTGSDPTFLKRERLYDPQRLNLYIYVRDNPLKFVDPTGEDLRIAVTNISTSAGRREKQSHVNHRPHGGQPQENVNTYKMTLKNDSGSGRTFNVTRDTNYNDTAARTRGQYVSHGETPPGDYRGHIRTDGSKGFRVEIYDPAVDNGTRSQIQLPDGTMKENAQIHIGPGCSEGCVLLTGGTSGRSAFEDAVRGLLREDRENNKGQDIYVRIEDRNAPVAHDEPDLPTSKNGTVIVTIPPKPKKEPQ
jgi:RHS repeat-associated protein